VKNPVGISSHPTVISPREGNAFSFGATTGSFKTSGSNSGSRFVVSELPHIPPGTLAFAVCPNFAGALGSITLDRDAKI
jgi:hypothetical protein